MDKKIKTLEKHLEIAEKEVMIAELENKKKQLDEEWAIEKFLTFLKDQDIELRTLKHEKQRIIDHRDQIIESYNHYHKELRAEKEKLNEQIQQKNKELKQKEKVVAKLRDLTAEIVSGASKLNDLLAEQDEELQQKNEETPKLKTQVFKKKGQLDSTTKVGKMKPRWKDWEMKKKEFLLNKKVKSANARAEKAPAWGGSCQHQPSHLEKKPLSRAGRTIQDGKSKDRLIL